MAVARAILEIVTDASGVQPGIDKTEKSMFSLGGVAGKVGGMLAGAFAITEIVSAAANVVNFAGELTDLSSKTGIGTTALQELKYAGSQVGVELETITGGVTGLQKRLAGGDASAVGAIKALGLNFDELRDKSPEDQFTAIAAEVAKVEDPAARVKLAMDLFGKAGAEMLPLLTDEFMGLTEKANTLGIVMDEETVASMDTLGDTVGDLMNVGGALIGKVLTPFIPLLTALAQGAMVVADVLGDGLGWAIDKIGEGLKWVSLQAISGLRSLLSMGQGITEMFPTLSGAIGLTDGMAKATGYLDAAEKALTTTKDEGGKASDRAGAATSRLNLNYKGSEASATAAAKAQKSLDAELQKMADTMTGKGLSAEVEKYSAALKLAESQGGLTSQQSAKLGKALVDLRAEGAKLTPELAALARQHDILNTKLPITTNAYQGLANILKTMPSYKLELPPVPADPWGAAESDPFSIIKTINRSLYLAGGPANITLGAAPIAESIGNTIKSSLKTSLAGLGDVIVGALQGGGDVAKSMGASILGGLGADLGKSLTKGLTGALGKELAGAIGSLAGPLGTMLGSLMGGAIDKLFAGNDTKKDREQAAKMMGFSSLAGLYEELRGMGEKGAALAHQGLNVIGKKDKEANAAWIKSVEELLEKQKTATIEAAKATEEAAVRETAAINTVSDAIRTKIDDLTSQHKALSDSIAQEAPEEIMGVIEAQQRAALAQIEVEKASLEAQLETSKDKILDTAEVVRAGIDGLFEKPIKVTFDTSSFAISSGGSSGGSASFGGAMAEGGVGRVKRPTWFLAGEGGGGGEDFAFSGAGRSFSDMGASSSTSRETAAELRGLRGDMRALLNTLPAIMESAARHGAQTAGRRR